jgi:hypothetical protein
MISNTNNRIIRCVLSFIIIFICFSSQFTFAEVKNIVVYGYSLDPSYKTNHIYNNNGIPSEAIFIKGECLNFAITNILDELGPNDTIGNIYFRDHGTPGTQSVGGGKVFTIGLRISVNESDLWGPEFDRLDGKWSSTAMVHFQGCNVGARELGAELVYQFAVRVGVSVRANVNIQYAGKQHEYEGPYQEIAPGDPKPDPIEPTDIEDPNDGAPEIEGIPTLSEWKQIFLTLLILSLVVGFMRTTHPRYSFSNSSTMLMITNTKIFAFNRYIYNFVFKWVGFVVILGLTGYTILFGHVSFLDIVGTLFCTPLVAYILHLIVLNKRYCEKA